MKHVSLAALSTAQRAPGQGRQTPPGLWPRFATFFPCCTYEHQAARGRGTVPFCLQDITAASQSPQHHSGTALNRGAAVMPNGAPGHSGPFAAKQDHGGKQVLGTSSSGSTARACDGQDRGQTAGDRQTRACCRVVHWDANSAWPPPLQ